jgi:hypothetical protein
MNFYILAALYSPPDAKLQNSTRVAAAVVAPTMAALAGYLT